MTSPSDATGRTLVILNPRAGAGKAGRGIDKLRAMADRVLGDHDLRVTEASGHATHLAAEAAEAGARLVVAVGGDGTAHEVVNGLFHPDGTRRGEADTALGLLPFGTGSDLQKSLEVPSDLARALAIVAGGTERRLDVGHAQVQGDRADRQEVFINVAGFGANGDVVRRANRMNKRLGGTITFFRAALQTALAWTPVPLRLTWRVHPDGPSEEWEGTVLSCFLANGAYCGGGMWVGRGGTMADGRFDVTILPPDSAVTQMVRSRRLYDGTVADWPGARRLQACELTAEPAGHRSAAIDLDGELGGSLPARFRVLPAALRVRGGWPQGSTDASQAPTR